MREAIYENRSASGSGNGAGRDFLLQVLKRRRARLKKKTWRKNGGKTKEQVSDVFSFYCERVVAVGFFFIVFLNENTVSSGVLRRLKQKAAIMRYRNTTKPMGRSECASSSHAMLLFRQFFSFSQKNLTESDVVAIPSETLPSPEVPKNMV